MRITTIVILLTMLIVPTIWAEVNATAETAVVETETGTDEENSKTEEKDGKRVFKDRVVVTASRQEQSASQTPAAISVISAEDIKNRNPARMVDLFKEIPSVDVQGEGPFRGLPVIRGLGSNRVLILVDGERLNNARESTLFAGIQIGLVDTSEIERVEVLRGPASVLYGSDAMGGVINIITKKPDLGAEEFKIHGNVNYTYGSAADSSTAQADVRGSGDGWGFNFSAGYQTSDDYKAPKAAADSPYYSEYVKADGTVPNSGMDQSSVQGGFRILTGDTGVFKTNLEVVRTSDIGFPGFDPETSGVDINFPRFDRDKLSAGWDSGPLGGLANLSFNGYFQHVVKESVMNIDPSPYFYIHSFTKSDVKTYGFNTQAIKDLGKNHLTMGLDFYQDNLQDEAINDYSYRPGNNFTSVPKSHQTGLGIYLQDEYTPTDRWRLLGGLRYDTFKFKSEDDPLYQGDPFDVTDSDVSGNIGAMYAVSPNVELTGLIGRGFRSPNIQERAYNGSVSEPGFWVVQNPDLTSERSLNYEVGFKLTYDRYYGGVNVFYNDVRDLITFVELGEDPNTGLNLIQYDNIEDATIKGIEIELETLFAKSWTMITNFSYTEGDDDNTGEPLGFIPPYKFVLGFRYQAPKWWWETTGRFVGEQTRVPSPENIADPEDDVPIGDFITVDMRAGYKFDSGLNLRATLGNIFNELYSEPFNLRPEPARYLRVSVGFSF